MPELPEVETVARDLRPLITGARIVDATTLWARTLRGIDPEAFATGVAGRRIEAVSRRGKQVVVTLDGGAFLTIHLKMTGQIFVVPQGGKLDPYVRLVVVLEDGREIRFRDIRKFGRIGLYLPDDADPFAATGPEPLADAFTVRAFRRRIRGRKGRLKSLLLDQ
jgi:formamidopyrimidine-DNA glycosylase